ncbi:MAG TPA: hypothetical protein DER64_00355 [Planctomycetaceae bacterium]|nr:hypothetical protein [Planctomycetaceae bacterium]
MPGLGIGPLDQVRAERVQPQLALLLGGAVATQAQPLQDRLDVTCERDRFRLVGHHRSGNSHDRPAGEAHQPSETPKRRRLEGERTKLGRAAGHGLDQFLGDGSTW